MALATTGADHLTEAGLSIGTPAYMSPEQVACERERDARSDIYSLARVTYEMLAGAPPFVALTAQGVMAKHVIDIPAPVTAKRPGLGPTLAAALAKALNKARSADGSSCLTSAGSPRRDRPAAGSTGRSASESRASRPSIRNSGAGTR